MTDGGNEGSRQATHTHNRRKQGVWAKWGQTGCQNGASGGPPLSDPVTFTPRAVPLPDFAPRSHRHPHTHFNPCSSPFARIVARQDKFLSLNICTQKRAFDAHCRSAGFHAGQTTAPRPEETKTEAARNIPTLQALVPGTRSRSCPDPGSDPGTDPPRGHKGSPRLINRRLLLHLRRTAPTLYNPSPSTRRCPRPPFCLSHDPPTSDRR